MVTGFALPAPADRQRTGVARLQDTNPRRATFGTFHATGSPAGLSCLKPPPLLFPFRNRGVHIREDAACALWATDNANHIGDSDSVRGASQKRGICAKLGEGQLPA